MPNLEVQGTWEFRGGRDILGRRDKALYLTPWHLPVSKVVLSLLLD